MKTIIIPTDFSPVATNAMNYGLDMAIAINASVLLFHVYGVPISMTEVPVMLISVEELEKNAEAQIAELKKDVEHIVSGKIKIQTETKLGDTIDELENCCDRVQPFAVVMGAKGSSGIESIFGSTTLSAIRRLRWPVISIPPGKEYGKGIRKIGFACDFRDVVETTPAGAIKEVVKQFNAEFHVLNVSPNNSDKGAGPAPDFELLKTMFQEVNPVYDFIEHADVDDGINEFAEKNNLDLVITIPKKHKLLEGLFRKRSTKQLLLHSHIPIMCVHED
jgi:nucleotide-binding universal stress UspA family protein